MLHRVVIFKLSIDSTTYVFVCRYPMVYKTTTGNLCQYMDYATKHGEDFNKLYSLYKTNKKDLHITSAVYYENLTKSDANDKVEKLRSNNWVTQVELW
jgi:hypothetical protein